MKRPKGVRFWTCADVERWIEKNVPLDKDDVRSSRQKTLWWQACAQASLLADLNHRELAEVFMDGIGRMSAKRVTEELQNRHVDADVEPKRPHYQVDVGIEEELLEFWFASENRSIRGSKEAS